jgi:hypothetical protein
MVGGHRTVTMHMQEQCGWICWSIVVGPGGIKMIVPHRTVTSHMQEQYDQSHQTRGD